MFPISEKDLIFESLRAWFLTPSGERSMQMKTSIKQWWNYGNRGKMNYSKADLSNDLIFHHKSHTYQSKTKDDPIRWEAGDQPAEAQQDF
jgi:hypothetical protein